MKNNRETSSDFLRNVESSARRILQKNNFIRSGKAKGQESISNEVDALHKLKISPFHSSSETRQKRLSTNDGIDRLPDHRIRRIFPTKTSGKFGRSVSAKKSNDEEQTNVDELEMDSSVLRKRFRCDLEFDKQDDLAIHKHPIQSLMTEHLASMTAKVDRMTEKRLSTMSSKVSDGQKDALAKTRSNVDTNTLASESTGDIGEKCFVEQVNFEVQQKKNQEQSVSTKKSCVDANYMDGGTAPKPILKESNRIIPSIAPECWNLVVLERIDEESFLSIHRIRIFNAEDLEKNHYWILDFCDVMYQRMKRYILFDDELASLASSVSAVKGVNVGDESFEPDDGVIVHKQSITTRTIEGSDLVGDYHVRINRSNTTLTAILSVHFQHCRSPLRATLYVPVYEIVAILNLHYLCKTLDTIFWMSSDNGDCVWEKLISEIDILMTKEKGAETLTLKPSWLVGQGTSALTQTIETLSPSKMACLQYRDALKNSNIILHSIHLSQSSRDKMKDILSKEVYREESRHLATERLEQDMMNAPPLSLRLCNTLAHSKSLMPGACVFGSVGSWRSERRNQSSDKLDCIDRTQAALTFMPQKDCTSPIVMSRLAFETPVPAPTYHLFDPTPITPSRAIDEPVNCPISTRMAKCSTLLEEKLISHTDERTIPGIVTIDSRSLATKEIDGMERFSSSMENNNLYFTPEGYRLRCLAHSINQNSSFPLHKFGITQEGVSPNQTGVNARTIWHSEEVCTHLLSKRRGSEDFFHMIEHEASGKDGGSPNDPLISIIYMDAYKTNFVQGTKLKRHEETERQKLIDAKEKKRKNIIAMKIEAADRILENKVKEISGPLEGFLDELDSSMNKGKTSSIPNEAKQSNESQWRALLGPIVGVNLIDMNKCKVGSYDENDFYRCTLNQPRMVSIVSAPSATSYSIDDIRFQTTMQTEFTDDLLEDRFHLSHQICQGQQSKDVLLNSEQRYALEHILKVPLEAPTEAIAPLEIQANHGVHTLSEVMDVSNVSNEERVIQATKHASYEILEEMLDDCGVDIDITDEYGNTLLILAGQQGNKKLCKFLLRRGAYINAQNHAGNTVLHYLHEYAHLDLADYMRRKGADDTYLNAVGLTCYEGVKK